MKTISQIQKQLDKINKTLFTEQSAAELRELENEWEGCFSLELGEMRNVTEDRFRLAHSRRRDWERRGEV